MILLDTLAVTLATAVTVTVEPPPPRIGSRLSRSPGAMMRYYLWEGKGMKKQLTSG